MYNIVARENVAPGENKVYEKEFHAAGIMDQLSLRFYPGQMLDLEIQIRIKRLGGSFVEVFNYVSHGSKTMAGDDDYFREFVGLEIYRGEVLQLYVSNKTVVPEGSYPLYYAYDFVLHTAIREVGDL